jgi:T-complex protein 1 subunit delta
MVIKDIERDEVEFICKTVGTVPVAHIDQLTPEKLGSAKLVEEVSLSDDSKIVKVTGVKEDAKTITMLIRGSSKLVVDEADRSMHDALCVVRSLVKSRGMVCGGGAPEIEMA